MVSATGSSPASWTFIIILYVLSFCQWTDIASTFEMKCKMYVQKLIQANNNKTAKFLWLAHCEGNPSMIGGSPQKGSAISKSKVNPFAVPSVWKLKKALVIIDNLKTICLYHLQIWPVCIYCRFPFIGPLQNYRRIQSSRDAWKYLVR